jgi:hypothetical protein
MAKEEERGWRSLRMLSGVNSFHFYDNVRGRRILVMGEGHDMEGLCPGCAAAAARPEGDGCWEVHTWLRALTSSARECIDVFVETEMEHAFTKDSMPAGGVRSLEEGGGGGGTKTTTTTTTTTTRGRGRRRGRGRGRRGRAEQQQQYRSPINAIQHVFEPCMEEGTRTADAEAERLCAHVRYHHVDVRYLDSGVSYPMVLLWTERSGVGRPEQYFTDLLALVDSAEMGWDAEVMRRFLGYALGLSDGDEGAEAYHGQMARFSELMEGAGQLTRRDPRYSAREDDAGYAGELRALVRKRFGKMFWGMYRELLEGLVEFYVFSGRRYGRWQDGFIMYPLDAYLVLRMFQKFSSRRMGRSPRGCRWAETPQNIVVHVGYDHARAVRYVLERVFGVEPLVDKHLEKRKKCFRFSPAFDFFERRELLARRSSSATRATPTRRSTRIKRMKEAEEDEDEPQRRRLRRV